MRKKFPQLIVILVLFVAIGFAVRKTAKTRFAIQNQEDSSVEDASPLTRGGAKLNNGDLEEVVTIWKRTDRNSDSYEIFIAKLEKDREAFVDLMQRSPKAALKGAVALNDWAKLPEDLKPFFPRVFSAIGDIDLLWETGIGPSDETSDHADAENHLNCQHHNKATIGGEKLTAYGADRAILPVVFSAPLAGVRIGDSVLITDSPVVNLSENDFEGANSLYPESAAGDNDAITGSLVENGQKTLIAGEILNFQRDDLLEHVDQTLTSAFDEAAKERVTSVKQPFEFLAASGGTGSTSSGTAATPYQQDDINVLFIRVDFSDFPGAPVSATDLQATLATVASRVDEFSYGAASVTSTVTTQVYRMPRRGDSYALDAGTGGNDSGNDDIHTDASALAAADYTLGNYDVIAVFFPSLNNIPNSLITYGGLASVGGSRHWINGFNSVYIILHEFGHNYGLYHANYFDPSMQTSGDYFSAGSLEYGDIFDVMGEGRPSLGHFSHYAKNTLDWLPDSKVAEVETTGTYRIYRFDDKDAIANPLLALKVPVSGDVNYWVGYRQLYTSSTYNLETSAYVVADNLSPDRESNLIDMTPDSSNNAETDRDDAGLPVGSSLSVSGGAITFEAIARGGA